MPRLNGGQVIGRILKEYGVPYVAGIPGHGIWGLMDAFNEDESKIPFIQTYHEQSAVHLADGYYRVSGKPMAAVTSIGAGAANTVLGLATAYSDSTSVLVITGGPPRHMRGRFRSWNARRTTVSHRSRRRSPSAAGWPTASRICRSSCIGRSVRC